MNINDLIKSIMHQKDLRQRDMNDRLNMGNQSRVSQYLSRELRVSMAIKFLSAMNCTLQVVDNDTGEVYEVTAE